MINDNTILSSFNDRPTLLEWLKKVEEALKSDTATGVSVENPSVNSYVFKITFADGKTIASDTIRFPDSVKGASILNNHLILTMQSGLTDDLGVINPYANTIVLNSETNTTEIGNNLQVNGTITAGGNVLSAVVANPTEETTGMLSKIKIGNTAYAVGGGGSGDNFLLANSTSNAIETGNNIYSFSVSVSDDEIAKLKNGNIKVISGEFKYSNGDTGYFSTSYCGNGQYGSNYLYFAGVNINVRTSKLEKFEIDFYKKTSQNEINITLYQYSITQG